MNCLNLRQFKKLNVADELYVGMIEDLTVASRDAGCCEICLPPLFAVTPNFFAITNNWTSALKQHIGFLVSILLLLLSNVCSAEQMKIANGKYESNQEIQVSKAAETLNLENGKEITKLNKFISDADKSTATFNITSKNVFSSKLIKNWCKPVMDKLLKGEHFLPAMAESAVLTNTQITLRTINEFNKPSHNSSGTSALERSFFVNCAKRSVLFKQFEARLARRDLPSNKAYVFSNRGVIIFSNYFGKQGDFVASGISLTGDCELDDILYMPQDPFEYILWPQNTETVDRIYLYEQYGKAVAKIEDEYYFIEFGRYSKHWYGYRPSDVWGRPNQGFLFINGLTRHALKENGEFLSPPLIDGSRPSNIQFPDTPNLYGCILNFDLQSEN